MYSEYRVECDNQTKKWSIYKTTGGDSLITSGHDTKAQALKAWLRQVSDTNDP